jgi:hypothetical protein
MCFSVLTLVVLRPSRRPISLVSSYSGTLFAMQTLFRYASVHLKQNMVGTARANRVPASLVVGKNELAVGQNGVVSTDSGAPMTAVALKGKGLVYLLSTMHNHDAPAASVTRRKPGGCRSSSSYVAPSSRTEAWEVSM